MEVGLQMKMSWPLGVCVCVCVFLNWGLYPCRMIK